MMYLNFLFLKLATSNTSDTILYFCFVSFLIPALVVVPYMNALRFVEKIVNFLDDVVFPQLVSFTAMLDQKTVELFIH